MLNYLDLNLVILLFRMNWFYKVKEFVVKIVIHVHNVFWAILPNALLIIYLHGLFFNLYPKYLFLLYIYLLTS